NADGRKADDEQAFRQWLAESPANAAAFERATDLWSIVPGAPVAPVPAPAQPVTRRRLLAACAGTLVVGGGGMAAMQTAYAGTRYETGIGEQRHVMLPEGSSLFLDADTQLRVLATMQRRRLWLRRGRVALAVEPVSVPFAIEAGNGSF